MATWTKPATAADVSPNLLPLVDVMLLLLIFFMLGGDMGPREREDVRLPPARAINACSSYGEREWLTINVYHRHANEVLCDVYAGRAACREPSHWLTGIRGADFKSAARLGACLKIEAAKHPDPQEKGLSRRRVRIRADATAPTGLVRQAMAACASAGIRRIECGAARGPARQG